MSRRGSILQDYGGHLNPMPTDAQLAAANYYQRDKEFNAQMKLNDSGNKLRDYKDATKFIYDQNIDRTGINDLDIENANQLLSAKNEMVRMLNEDKATLQDVQLYGMRTLPKIDKASTLGKNYKTQIDKGAVDMEKKYGNGFDISAYYNEAYKRLSNDLLDKDEKGEVIGYKDPSLIPKNRDYAAEIENDNASLGTIFKPSGALVKHLSSLPTPVISNSTEVKGKDGRLRYNGYTGQGSVFVEEDIDPETGVTKGLRYKSEKVPLGVNDDGTTRYAEVLPVDEMGIIMENPAVAKEVDYKFKNYLGEIKKQSSEHGWGDGFKEITEFDPRAIDILKRGFVRDWLIETNADGSAFNPKMKDIAPTTKIYNGSGNGAVNINNLYGRIGKKIDDNIANGFDVTRFSSLTNDEQAIVKQVVENAGYDLEGGGANIYLSKDGNNYKVYKAENGKPLPKDGNNEIATLSFEGINTKVQPGAKEKREVIEQGKSMKSDKPKTITAAKLKSLVGTAGYEGYTEKEIQDYYRKNGYEIK